MTYEQAVARAMLNAHPRGLWWTCGGVRGGIEIAKLAYRRLRVRAGVGP